MNTENEIKTKITRHKYKDRSTGKIKSPIDELDYITIKDIQILLDIQEHKCYICKQNVIIHSKPRCLHKFSIDRLNEHKPHINGNVLIACFWCNCRDFLHETKCLNCSTCAEKNRDIRTSRSVERNEIEIIIQKYSNIVSKQYTFEVVKAFHYEYAINEIHEKYKYSKEHINKMFSTILKPKCSNAINSDHRLYDNTLFKLCDDFIPKRNRSVNISSEYLEEESEEELELELELEEV